MRNYRGGIWSLSWQMWYYFQQARKNYWSQNFSKVGEWYKVEDQVRWIAKYVRRCTNVRMRWAQPNKFSRASTTNGSTARISRRALRTVGFVSGPAARANSSACPFFFLFISQKKSFGFGIIIITRVWASLVS